MQFRPKSFWTPRYVTNRLRLALDQKLNPEAPWWPREAARHLDGMLRHGDRCLEWGSGRSTVWLSARTSTVHSVEHDREWFGRVQELLTSQRLDAGAVELLSTDSADGAEHSPYVRIVDRFGPGEISVFIVDGEHRGKCALAAVPKLATGGIIVVDDAHWFLDHPTHAPHARAGRGPADADWRRFSALVADWRCVWTTDGVTDTAIWVKP